MKSSILHCATYNRCIQQGTKRSTDNVIIIIYVYVCSRCPATCAEPGAQPQPQHSTRPMSATSVPLKKW